MENLFHPSSFLHADSIDIIRDEAPLAEQQRALTTGQLELIYRRGWFKLFVPGEHSGSELSMPEALQLEEALCWADGSLGWTVTLCSGAGWFSGFLSPALTLKAFCERTVCFGGSGAPTGVAVKTKNGYIVTGRWKYATGANHLTHFTANCVIKDQGEIVLNENEEPTIQAFIFERSEVTIIPDWNTIGLIATSSHSFEVSELLVSADRRFQITPQTLSVQRPIYQYPFLQFAELTLAVNISGIAVHFIDCCRPIFQSKIGNNTFKEPQRHLLTKGLANAELALSEARAVFYRAAEKSWQTLIRDGMIPESDLQEISRISRQLAFCSQDAVHRLYPLCGLSAADPTSEINRVWRDIHTASQHSLLTLG